MHKNVNNFLLTQLDLDGIKRGLDPQRQEQNSPNMSNYQGSGVYQREANMATAGSPPGSPSSPGSPLSYRSQQSFRLQQQQRQQQQQQQGAGGADSNGSLGARTMSASVNPGGVSREFDHQANSPSDDQTQQHNNNNNTHRQGRRGTAAFPAPLNSDILATSTPLYQQQQQGGGYGSGTNLGTHAAPFTFMSRGGSVGSPNNTSGNILATGGGGGIRDTHKSGFSSQTSLALEDFAQQDRDGAYDAQILDHLQVNASVHDSVHHGAAAFAIFSHPWRLSFPCSADALTFDYPQLLGKSYLLKKPLGRAAGIKSTIVSPNTPASAAPPAPLSTKRRIAIVGAGLAGTLAARELARTGLYDVDLYESSDRVGGRLMSQRAVGIEINPKTGEKTYFPQVTCFEQGAMRIPFFNTTQPLKPGSGPYVGGPYHFGWRDNLGPRSYSQPCPINSLAELLCQMYELSTAAFPDPGKAPGTTLKGLIAHKVTTLMGNSPYASRAASFQGSQSHSQFQQPRSGNNSASQLGANNNAASQQASKDLFGVAPAKSPSPLHSNKKNNKSNKDGDGDDGTDSLHHSHERLDLQSALDKQEFSHEDGYEGIKTVIYVNNGFGIDLREMYPDEFPDEATLPSRPFAYEWPAENVCNILFPHDKMTPAVMWFHEGEPVPTLPVPFIKLDHCVPKFDEQDPTKYVPKSFGTRATNPRYETDVTAWSKGIDAIRTVTYKWSVFAGCLTWAISNQADQFLLDGFPIEKTPDSWYGMRFDSSREDWEHFWFYGFMPHYQTKSFAQVVSIAPIIPTRKTPDGKKWIVPEEWKQGWFGGLGMNAAEFQLLGVLGLSDGSWNPFFPLSSLWIIRAIFFGYANQHQLILGKLNKEQTDIDTETVDPKPDRTPFGFPGRNTLKDSRGNSFQCPQYAGVGSLAEMNIFAPLDVLQLNNKADSKSPSFYDLATSAKPRGSASSGHNLLVNTKVSGIHRKGDYNIEVTSTTTYSKDHKTQHTSSYDFVLCTIPIWNTATDITWSGFNEAGVPLATRTAAETSHWIRSAKVFVALKEAFWITKKDELAPVFVTDTILQDFYCLLAPIPENQKAANPNHLNQGVALISYVWEDQSSALSSYHEKELALILLKKVNEVWQRSGIKYRIEDFLVDPTLETPGSFSVWRWSHDSNYHGCAKAYQPQIENLNSLLLNFNNYYSKRSQLYFAGDANSLESGWLEPAVRLAIDSVLNIINNDPNAEIETLDGTFDFKQHYYFPPIVTAKDAQVSRRVVPLDGHPTRHQQQQQQQQLQVQPSFNPFINDNMNNMSNIMSNMNNMNNNNGAYSRNLMMEPELSRSNTALSAGSQSQLGHQQQQPGAVPVHSVLQYESMPSPRGGTSSYSNLGSAMVQQALGQQQPQQNRYY